MGPKYFLSVATLLFIFSAAITILHVYQLGFNKGDPNQMKTLYKE